MPPSPDSSLEGVLKTIFTHKDENKLKKVLDRIPRRGVI
jgi:hypothetical protein